MSTGVHHPYRRAIWTVLGIVAGIQTLVAVVAVGLGALVAASGAVLGAVRWLGVAYLVYLGLQQWRAPAGAVAAREGGSERETPGALFLRGYLVNVTNPKGIIFLLAVLPQFVDPARPAAPQYALCGASLALTDLVVMSGYAVVARSVLRWYGSPSHLRWLDRLFGTLFVAAGLGLAVWRRG
jgi:homoserine/homoserine lactone efflux protein